MYLNELKPVDGARHAKKRVGRGIGSGMGKTATRGHKGQNARSCGEEEEVKEFSVVNLGDINEKFESGAVVDVQALKTAGLVKKEYEGVKILSNGEVTKALTIKARKFSKVKINAAGGTVEVA